MSAASTSFPTSSTRLIIKNAFLKKLKHIYLQIVLFLERVSSFFK